MLNTILSRRSIRKYKPDPVPEQDVLDILRAAMSAPSTKNQQPWHFVVITDREVLNNITEFHPYAQMLKTAPCAILVVGDTNIETHPGYWVVDCSAAMENILLAAHSKGLGSVWIGIYPREERISAFEKLINLPVGFKPLALAAIGYPLEIKPPSNRFDEKRIHKNKW